MKQERLEQKIMLISTDTIIHLFDQENWSDLVSLYMFYHKQSKIQKTNRSWTTTQFVMDWLHWSNPRVVKAKNGLKDLWLIEDITERWNDGKVTWHYIQLNYIESSTPPICEGVENPDSGVEETNAWSNININAWNNLNLNACSETGNSSYEEWTNPDTPTPGIPETGTSRIKERVIPTLAECEAKYWKSRLNELILSIFELKNFTDKVDLNRIQDYYDYILETFKVVYWWSDTELKANREQVFYHIDSFRKYYLLRPEKDIKKFKGRLLNWIEGSLKFSNQK